MLVAEDDESYALLLKRAFLENGLANPLHLLCDGQQVIDYLAASENTPTGHCIRFPV